MSIRHKFDLKGWGCNTVDSFDKTYQHKYYYLNSKNSSKKNILFIHGMNVDARVFVNMYNLAENYNLYSYELPDKSIQYTGDISDFSNMLNDFIKIIGIKETNLIGNSFGGVVVASFVSRSNIPIKNIILISTPTIGTTPEKQRRGKLLRSLFDNRDDSRIKDLMTAMVSEALKESKNNESLMQIIILNKVSFFKQIAEVGLTYNEKQDLQAIKCPALILHSRRDRAVSINDAKELCSYLENGQKHFYKEATHSMAYHNGEEIATRIASFLGRE